jgi:hypothetical protein
MVKMHFIVLVLILGVFLYSCSDDNPVEVQNQNPIISAITCDPDTVLLGETSTIVVSASDPDGDPLTYVYTSTSGSVSGNGNSATFTAGNTPGEASVNVTVGDDRGGSVNSSISLLMLLRAKDGSWEGTTSQSRDIMFAVSNQGTQIDSGLTITMFCSEYWGTVTITVTRLNPLSITDNEFTWIGSDFNVKGDFESTTHSTGIFSVSGNTGYPFYLPYSTAGSFSADWISALSSKTQLSVHEGIIENKKQYVTEKRLDNEILKITYELLE